MKRWIAVLLPAVLVLALLTGCSTPVYEVRYEPNGGTVVSGELLQKVEKGGSAADPEVEREGYAFKGWDKSAASVSENMVLVAQWEKQYTVTFDLQGGTLVKGEEKQTLVKGETPVEPTVELEGSTFQGWSPEVTEVSGNVTYKAQWKRIEYSAKEVYKRVRSGVGEIVIYNSDGEAEAQGTGFFINDKGCMVTNYHVMKGAYSAEVTLYNGARYDVDAVIDYNASVDICMIKVDVTDNDYLTMSTRPVETGETVYALGSPRGQTGTFTDGIVSINSNVIDDVEYIQFTAPISPGNSGGPLLNTSAEVVGINTMSMLESQNMNYAISIKAVDDLDQHKHTSMKNFYQETNESYLWVEQAKAFVRKASFYEEESNDTYLNADPLTKGKWTAAVLPSEEDLDWFYIELTSPRRLTFELAPYINKEAEEIIGVVFVYKDNEMQPVGILEESGSYTYKTEKVFVYDAEEAGYYFLAVTHDSDYKFGNPYIYLARVS